MQTSSPLVGMHFRPPAKAILGVLRQGTPLTLEREPGNEYDPQAVKVLLDSAHIPSSQLDELDNQASGFGFSAEQIMAQPQWHLGYIAAKAPKGRQGILASQVSLWLDSGKQGEASLSFDGSGQAEVKITWEPWP